MHVRIVQGKLQSEFDRLLRPYAEYSGVTEDDIDDELSDAQERMTNLQKRRRHDTPEGKALQRKITDLKLLVELRGLILAEKTSNALLRRQELQSEFDRLLRPYAEDWAVAEDDIDDELRDAQERMTKLREKGRHNKFLHQKITDFERLVELRDLLRNPPSVEGTEALGSKCDDVSRAHTEVTGACDEPKDHHDSADGGGFVGTYGAVGTGHHVTALAGSNGDGDNDNHVETVDRGTDIEVNKCCCTIM